MTLMIDEDEANDVPIKARVPSRLFRVAKRYAAECGGNLSTAVRRGLILLGESLDPQTHEPEPTRRHQATNRRSSK